MNRKINFLIFLGLATLTACDGDSEQRLKPDYLPLQKGLYHIYTVEETVYSEVADPEHHTYELMLEVADSFPNAEAGLTYVIYRSKRNNAPDPWEYIDTRSVRKDDFRINAIEENTVFVKLAFPVIEGRQWDGNAFNDLGKDDYSIMSVDTSYTAANVVYADCVVINQEDNRDFIVFQDKRREVYAAGVGLIYKSTTQLRYCTTENCLGQQIVLDGVIFVQELKEYGIL